MPEMTRHELLRERWLEKPERFPPENYGKGYPVPTSDGWVWHDWPESSDIGLFALPAAKEMLAADPMACPLDVIDFATVLRRKYILETLNLPTDPESLHTVRIIEVLKAKELGRFLNADEAKEAVAYFCLHVDKAKENIRDLRHLPKEEQYDIIGLVDLPENMKKATQSGE